MLQDWTEKVENFFDIFDDVSEKRKEFHACLKFPGYGEIYRRELRARFDAKVKHKRLGGARRQAQFIRPWWMLIPVAMYIISIICRRPWPTFIAVLTIGLIDAGIAWLHFSAVKRLCVPLKEAHDEAKAVTEAIKRQDAAGASSPAPETQAPPAAAEQPPATPSGELDLNALLAQASAQASRRMQS